jgi:hypothetical protein
VERGSSVLAALLLASLLGACGSPSASQAHDRGRTESGKGITTSKQCPRSALSLPGDAVARAADQALVEAPALYSGLKTGKRRVIASQRAAFAGVRGKQILNECGRRAYRKTVVVDFRFPLMLPSASLSQGTVFISRFPHGYRVWEVAH